MTVKGSVFSIVVLKSSQNLHRLYSCVVVCIKETAPEDLRSRE